MRAARWTKKNVIGEANRAERVQIDWLEQVIFDKPDSQSCAVAKNVKSWRPTEQSNLADRVEHCSAGQSTVVWVQKANLRSFCCGRPFFNLVPANFLRRMLDENEGSDWFSEM